MPEKRKQEINPGGADLNKYLQSPRPGSWLILTLVLLLIAMVVVWAFLGNMKTTVAVTGIHEDGHFVGYIKPKDAISLQVGMEMDFNGETVGILAERGTMTFSMAEVSEQIGNS